MNAVILAHYYRIRKFRTADFVGDSLQLSSGCGTSADVIVFAGVLFMAKRPRF